MTETIKNYTETQEEEMVAVYTASTTDKERAQDVENLANKFGKKVNSIRQKLVKLNIYIKPEKVTKAGAKIERKADIVSTIAITMNEDADLVSSLEKGTKNALEKVRDFMLMQNAKIAELEEIINSDIEVS